MDSTPDLTADAIGKLLQCSGRTIERWWRIDGTFPPPDFHKGAVILWKRETLDAWIRLWPWIRGLQNRANEDQIQTKHDKTGTISGQTKK